MKILTLIALLLALMACTNQTKGRDIASVKDNYQSPAQQADQDAMNWGKMKGQYFFTH